MPGKVTIQEDRRKSRKESMISSDHQYTQSRTPGNFQPNAKNQTSTNHMFQGKFSIGDFL